MNLEQARENMIKQQLRTWEVLDEQVLELISQVPREDFVPPAYKNLAYGDVPLPIGEGQTMMNPKQEAHIIQAIKVQSNEDVLEVGTGSGYLTALLAKQAKHVYSVEYYDSLLEQAREKLSQQGINNVTLEQGDASQGWSARSMYEVIVITGSIPILPQIFLDSLTIGGRLFAIIGDYPLMEATLITRTGNTEWSTDVLFETELPPLVNAPQSEQFVL
ncbi:MAG: protein-L-isoaspartate O-methyltransferase [Gammaproteobacteria bacterium]|nr:protein-L-isoaspartate O-methyltransferase [Gammaproteobacteria bacterium]